MMTIKGKALVRALVVLLLAGVVPVAAAGSAEAGPYCGIWWGSQRKQATGLDHPYDGPRLTNVRSGRHACFDRLVFDTRGVRPGYEVRYVDQVLRREFTDEGEPQTGASVPVRGGARLDIVIPATRYDSMGDFLLYAPKNTNELVNVSGYRTFRQVKLVDESTFLALYPPFVPWGDSHIGLGVRARLPFRVFLLPGLGPDTSRLVIDVAHRW